MSNHGCMTMPCVVCFGGIVTLKAADISMLEAALEADADALDYSGLYDLDDVADEFGVVL